MTKNVHEMGTFGTIRMVFAVIKIVFAAHWVPNM